MKLRVKPGFLATLCFAAWVDGRLCLHFILALICHELGHCLAMKLLRVPISGIQLQGAGAVIAGEFPGYVQEFFCALAGPVASFTSAALAYRWMPRFAVVSCGLALVNLLPVYPLDGGRTLRAVLMLQKEPETAERILTLVSAGVCCLLMLVACWAAVALQSGLWPVFTALAVLWRVGVAKWSEQ